MIIDESGALKMFGSIGISEILIILVVALVLLGSKQLTEVARSIGKGWHFLQKTTQDVRKEIKEMLDDNDLLG